MLTLKFFLHSKYSILLVVLMSISQIAYSQSKIQQIDQLNQKAAKLYYKPDSMIIYARESYKLALESNYKSGEALAVKFLATYEHYKSNFGEALKLYFQALHQFEIDKNKDEIARTMLSIAIVYNNTNDHINSIKYGLQTLKMHEDLKDLRGQGKILNLLGISCAKQGDLKRAKVYFLQYNALSKRSNTRDTVDLAYSYNNLGGVDRDLKIIDSALYYFKIASGLFKKKNYLQGVALADKNIGSVYMEKKDFQNALVYEKKSLATSLIIGDKRNTCFAYQEMAICYKELKDTTNAYLLANKALSLAKVIGEKEVIRDIYKVLSELDKGKENYKSAYQNLLASRTAHDSLLNTEKTKIIQDLTTKYETVKKEKEIKSLNQQTIIQQLKIRQRNIFLIIALAVLLLGALLSYLLFSRRKLKARAELQVEINKQQDLAAKAVLDAEERERRRIAGDLHDGVGQLLSAALMGLNGLVQQLKLNKETSLQAEQAISLVNDSYDEMRSISHQMMPNALIKSGLASAVKEFLNKIDKDIIKVSLETIGLKERLDEQTETVLYRVIQETVNNVIKHSGANRLDIVIIKDVDGVSATVEDNGRGFDKLKVNLKDGIGISNMLSRVEFLKGTVDIDSALGKGTLVAIYIPD